MAQAELLYRDAQLQLAAAQERLDSCYGVLCEARVLAQSRFEVEPYDERSMAERMADRAANRDDTSYGAWRDAQVQP